MPIELLQSNVRKAKDIVTELNTLSTQLSQLKQAGAIGGEMALLEDSMSSLIDQLKIVNNALPEITNGIQFYKELSTVKVAKAKPAAKAIKGLARISYKHPAQGKVELGVKKKEQVKFLDSLTKQKAAAEKIKKKQIKIKPSEDKKPAVFYIKLSNKFFRNLADSFIEKNYFEALNKELRKITSPFLLNTYVSMLFMTTALAFIFGLLLASVFMIFGNILLAMAVLFGIPIAAFVVFYTYPASQRKNLEKEINQELPFVTIYMSAVATSGIEPSKIFEIIVRTKDYPFTQREIKKLLNYINFYGYDLVSALREGSKYSPSDRLSMLFNGLATTIRSGGELTEFLNKHAESLLFDYRLEREKYTKLAETFMDIYISIVIAAPMIMMILFVLISLTGYATGFLSPGILSVLIIFIVSILNIGFLVFLNLKQPKF